MNITSIIGNELVADRSSVWLLKGHATFSYSEGASAERYLESVLTNATDLSANSSELEGHIKDWSSEYHLSSKRAQLLSGFNFDRSLKVLEVGCGCGAITRYLGESFDQVVSVEGSLARARLARLRTRDLSSVSIVCAPFQDVRFSEKFDIIFAIGVYEYSASFVKGDNPYDAVLKYFSDVLTPDGVVVIAIENQFGLKYFDGHREDHLDVPFEGLEGYHRRRPAVRTFGKVEIENNIKRHFSDVRFFYPYPDYKVPDCVVSSEFLRSERAGELISQINPRDYAGFAAPLWDGSATALELARNGMLEFFSNSFLVVAGRKEIRGVEFNQLAILYSSGRNSAFATQTRVVMQEDESWLVSKRARRDLSSGDDGPVKLVNIDAPWLDDLSLHTQVRLRSMSNESVIDDIFKPCRSWIDLLNKEAFLRDGVKMLSGAHVDTIWQNVYPQGNHVRIIDREWIWREDIPLNVLVIRAIYYFLAGATNARIFGQALNTRSGRTLTRHIAAVLGVKLDSKDFETFVELETEIQFIVFGTVRRRQRIYLRWFLLDRGSLDLFLQFRRKAMPILRRILNRMA